MTHSRYPALSLTRNLHRMDPQLLKRLFQPSIDAIGTFMDYYEELDVRFPTPLEKECQRATRAYFDKHAGQIGTRS